MKKRNKEMTKERYILREARPSRLPLAVLPAIHRAYYPTATYAPTDRPYSYFTPMNGTDILKLFFSDYCNFSWSFEQLLIRDVACRVDVTTTYQRGRAMAFTASSASR